MKGAPVVKGKPVLFSLSLVVFSNLLVIAAYAAPVNANIAATPAGVSDSQGEILMSLLSPDSGALASASTSDPLNELGGGGCPCGGICSYECIDGCCGVWICDPCPPPPECPPPPCSGVYPDCY